jgi:hypothetical protein
MIIDGDFTIFDHKFVNPAFSDTRKQGVKVGGL